AFAQLDRKYRARLTASALARLPRMAGRREKAEDLAGQVLAQAADTIGRPNARWKRNRGMVGPWLASILHNVVVSHLRLKHGLEMVFSELAPEEQGEAPAFEGNLPAEVPTPEAEVLDQLTEEALRRCLEELPVRERWVVTMQFWDGLRNKEIA